MSLEWNRRQMLSALSAGMLMPKTALGFGSDSRFHVAELDLGRGSLHRPQAWKRMLHEIIDETSSGSGRINVKELGNYLQEIGMITTVDELHRLWDKYDGEKSGGLNSEQFVDLMSDNYRANQAQDLIDRQTHTFKDPKQQ